MIIQGQVGPTSSEDGVQAAARQGKLGDVIVSELHGRYYETNYRGATYRTGATAVTALSANTITSATSATGTPIVGVYNPVGSNINLVILQAYLQVFANNLTSGAAPGAFVWLTALNQSAISTGSTPINAKTLAASGSVAKGFTGATALTGLSGSMAVAFPADFPNLTGLTYTTLGSTAMIPSAGGVANYDGSIIVPPGGILGLYNTVSSTTFSQVSGLLWEEVPV